MPDQLNLTFAAAFDLVWEDVLDCVLQHATPLQALTYAVVDMTPGELAHTLLDNPNLGEAYLVVRDHHGIDRP